MAKKAPGKHFRKGITLEALFRMFPDDATAEAWFIEQRWPNGVACPRCGDIDVHVGSKHPTMPLRCRGCNKRFSVKIGSIMEGSNIGYRAWAIAIHALSTNLKGVSSMKLRRDLGITQKSAWYMAHRIRESWSDDQAPFAGPVEFDESFMGGKEKNKHTRKKLKAGTGMVGKVAVAGARDRETGKVMARPIEGTKKHHIHEFVHSVTANDDVEIFTDDHGGYKGLPHKRETVNHGIGEYVRGHVHTNGIESFWAMFKRGHKGVYHKMSKKHLRRYVTEYVGRHNERPSDTIDQMGAVVRGMEGKRLSYADLIAPNGLESGARPQR